ncbi:MAG TPA: DUF305 domain-containing protein [Microvirga sp.]|nr:DUF305 domain-containing protein [Microvirga sp.]
MASSPDLPHPSERHWRETKRNWIAAVILGLITSTFSTILVTFGAARVGRDAATDWMVVASIPFQDIILEADPSWKSITLGILFHQWADFSWEVFFFGVLGRWTARLNPRTLLAVAPFWAIFTSAMEWFVIVPHWQPIFVLEQTYWIGLAVHLASASLYPLFPYIRDRVAGTPSRHRRFAATWSGLAAAGALAFGILAFLGSQNREFPPHMGDAAFDRSFLRRMGAHHEQGIRLAEIGMERAQDEHLKRLARLMVASQRGDVAIFDQWWRSWFAGERPPATREEHAAMPGMLPAAEVECLRRVPHSAFDALFREEMSRHHAGAVAMADEALRAGGDPRVKIMAHAMRHAQRGEIELMQGIGRGWPTVKAAVSAMLEDVGAGRAERRAPAPHPH